ncbi:MAG: hypothetical protein K2X48_07465 [Chitinophagaceae bacterium]|nr:hypothetical protein [Chitinophagaceae bacterium]
MEAKADASILFYGKLSCTHTRFRRIADINLNYAHAKTHEHKKAENYIPLTPVFTSIGGISYVNKDGFNGSLR